MSSNRIKTNHIQFSLLLDVLEPSGCKAVWGFDSKVEQITA